MFSKISILLPMLKNQDSAHCLCGTLKSLQLDLTRAHPKCAYLQLFAFCFAVFLLLPNNTSRTVAFRVACQFSSNPVPDRSVTAHRLSDEPPDSLSSFIQPPSPSPCTKPIPTNSRSSSQAHIPRFPRESTCRRVRRTILWARIQAYGALMFPTMPALRMRIFITA